MKKLLGEILTGEKCDLVPISIKHTELIVAWRNKKENADKFLSQAVLSKNSHEKWLERVSARDDDFNWMICLKSGKPIGTVAIYNIDCNKNVAEFGRLLIGDPTERGRGYAAEALNLVLKTLKTTSIQKVYLIVKSDNLPALSLYKRCGFQAVKFLDSQVEMERRL